MRFHILILLPISTAVSAQQAAGPVQSPAPRIATPLPAPDISPDQQAKPLAAARNGNRILSKNEAYNAARIAEGRAGSRLGNDMSYRITGN